MMRRFALAAVVGLVFAFGLWMRGEVRTVVAPFEGLDRFARRTPPPDLEPALEPVVIDWDAPPAPPPKRTIRSAAVERPRTEPVLLTTAVRLHFQIGWREAAVTELLPTYQEPGIETLSTTLNLSESQKARIGALMERRGQVQADAFERALLMELDQVQARKYQDLKGAGSMKESVRSEPRFLSESLKRVAER